MKNDFYTFYITFSFLFPRWYNFQLKDMHLHLNWRSSFWQPGLIIILHLTILAGSVKIWELFGPGGTDFRFSPSLSAHCFSLTSGVPRKLIFMATHISTQLEGICNKINIFFSGSLFSGDFFAFHGQHLVAEVRKF